MDACLPEDLGEVSPARILEVVRAKIIEADPARHAAALEEEKRRRYVSLSRTDEFGLRHVIARVRAGDAAWVDAIIDRVADLLAPRFPDGTTKDVLRSEAFGWLARPADLLDLLTGGNGEGQGPAAARPRVVLYLHLHEAAVRADHGVARVEDIGPVLSREIPEWLGHTHVTVKPVLDLAEQVAFDAYEHPESLTERIHLRSPADSFPHANQVSRRLDHDHVEPFVPGTHRADRRPQHPTAGPHRPSRQDPRRLPGPTTRAGRLRLAHPPPPIPTRQPPRHHHPHRASRLRTDVRRPDRPRPRPDDTRPAAHRKGAYSRPPSLISRLRSVKRATSSTGSCATAFGQP